MIVYNVGRRFFALMQDARDHAKETGLKRSDIIKVTIANRDQLAALLDGLMGLDGVEPVTDPPITENVLPDADVPKFIREAWAKIPA